MELKDSIIQNVVNHPLKSFEKVKIKKKEFAIGFWHFEKVKIKKKIIGINLKGLYRDGILKELNELGFHKRELTSNREGIPIMRFIHESENIITIVEYKEIKDTFYKLCIEGIKDPINIIEGGKTFIFDPRELIDKYLKQFHLLFNESFLSHLKNHTLPILEDTDKSSFFFFRNVIIKSTVDDFEEIRYNRLNGYCVWYDHIIDREFKYTDFEGCHMDSFINNVANNENDRKEAFYCAIGYLLHNYSHESRGQAVICYDESPTKKGVPMGGTGKGLLANALKNVRSLVKIDGKKYRSDDKFKWQTVTPTTQVVYLDDVHDKFAFEDLHSLLTDGMNVEQKHRDEYFIPPIKTPKFIITSNTILNGKGTTNERRQFILEFSDFYSKVIQENKSNHKPEPIKEKHGCTFFSDDWNQGEWNKFFSLMIHCSHFYFINGLKTYGLKNVANNTFIQSTNENFVEWIENNGWLKTGEKRKLREAFEDFRDSYYGSDSDFPQGTFTKWLKIYAGSLDMERKISGSNKDKDIQFIKI